MNYKIAFYIRVSTEEQAENPEGSIKNQEERLKEVVKFKNQVGNFGEVVGTFIDRGRSGKDTNRPELQKMLMQIQKREISLLMVTELSRVSRSIKDFAGIWEMMQEAGCGFYSLRENFDTTTAAGEMVLYSLANIAQFERRQVSERVEANVRARSQRGLYNGGHVPLGYKLIADKPGFLEVDSKMAAIVRDAFVTFLKEGTLNKSARALNDKGYKIERLSQGGGRYTRLGHFTFDNLHRVLTNKAYIGIKTFKNKKGGVQEAPAVWPPIVDQELFERVQKKLKFNCGRQKPKTPEKYPYILSGLVFCSTCGSTMCGKSAHGMGGKIGYYEHSWLTKRNTTLSKKLLNCEPNRVLAKKLEPVVWDEVKRIIQDKKFAQKIMKEAKDIYESQSDQKEKDNLKAKVHGFSSQLEAITERLAQLPKTVSATPFFKQMEKIEKLKQTAERELENWKVKTIVEEKPAAFKTYEMFLERLKAFVTEDIDSDTKAKLIQKLVNKINVNPKGIEIEYFVGENYFERELVGYPTGARPFFMSKIGEGANKSLSGKDLADDFGKNNGRPLDPNVSRNEKGPLGASLAASSNFLTRGSSNNLTFGARERT